MGRIYIKQKYNNITKTNRIRLLGTGAELDPRVIYNANFPSLICFYDPSQLENIVTVKEKQDVQEEMSFKSE